MQESIFPLTENLEVKLETGMVTKGDEEGK